MKNMKRITAFLKNPTIKAQTTVWFVFLFISVSTVWAADSKVSDLSAPAGGPAPGDKAYIIDVSTGLSTADTYANILGVGTDLEAGGALSASTVADNELDYGNITFSLFTAPINNLDNPTGAMNYNMGTYGHAWTLGTAGFISFRKDGTDRIDITNDSGDPTISFHGTGKAEFGQITSTDDFIHVVGAGDEIAEEYLVGGPLHKSWSFDPVAVCAGDVDALLLMTVGDNAPNGIRIVEWSVSFSQDPGTEFGTVHVLLKRATAFIGQGSAATMGDLETTSVVSGEDTYTNINTDGSVVANGQVIFLDFDTAYTATGEQVIFEMWYYAVD